ncbi:MAG TPA: hypothetical protein DHW61_04890 [Lachnoclostridium phytofermentans]|uniref:Uncharacterized protein n=1 Tax=Lachnoclostridium phytofermentans TaxID=66219 RepID=A0A3D2X3Q8_9FIRM|nr:hypothetical protein [Lachnoclostridium sp.]HCL01742.1 hypothetical protein [Lachnoclostridium phytofermentans]
MEETNQAEKSPDNITSFSGQSRTSKMIQAAAPYLDSGTRKTADLFVKFNDFMDMIRTFRQQGGLNLFGRKKADTKDNKVSATGLPGLQGLFPGLQGILGLGKGEGSINFEGILRSVRPYCTPSEISLVDNILNIFNMKRFMDMYQNMSGMMNTSGTMNMQDMMSNLPNIMNMMNMMGGFPFGGATSGSPQNAPSQDYNAQGSPPPNASAPPPSSMNYDNSYYESTSPTPYDMLYQAMYGQSPPPDATTTMAGQTVSQPSNIQAAGSSPASGNMQSNWSNYNAPSPVNLPPYDMGNMKKDVTSAPYYTSNNTPYRATRSAAEAARKGNSAKFSQNVTAASNTPSGQPSNHSPGRPNNQQMFDMLASMVPPEQKNTFDTMKKMFESGMFMPT